MEYTYEVVSNKDVNSAGYNKYRNIVGVEEYHAGQADKISGLEVKDEKTLVIHFKEMKPEMKFPGSGYVIGKVMPYHYLKGIPFDQLASSDKLQKILYSMDHSRSKTWSRVNRSNGSLISIMGAKSQIYLRSRSKWSILVTLPRRCALINMMFC